MNTLLLEMYSIAIAIHCYWKIWHFIIDIVFAVSQCANNYYYLISENLKLNNGEAILFWLMLLIEESLDNFSVEFYKVFWNDLNDLLLRN